MTTDTATRNVETLRSLLDAVFRDGGMSRVWGSYDLAAVERVAEAIARGEEVSV